MPDIKLNFINNSSDANNSSVVIFQKNVAMNANDLPVAWKVITNCGQGDNHPFTFPMNMAISASDSYGNATPQQPAHIGAQFSMQQNASGNQLSLSGSAISPNLVQVLNNLPSGAINANCYKDGRLLATKTGIAPQQNTSFQFKPTISIGISNQVEEGQVMDSAIISQINTELSLFGISSADIVMAGGGSGPNAKPLTFTLQNIVWA